MITIKNKFPAGSFVYLKSDPDATIRQILSIGIFPDKSFMYRVACGTMVTMHHEEELSTTVLSELELIAE